MRAGFVIALATCLPLRQLVAQAADTTPAPAGRGLRVFAYPYVFYSPETSFAFGAGGIASFRTGREPGLRPSSVTLSAYYTANRQYKFTASHDLYAAANRTAATVYLSFGEFIDKFYGTGPEAPDTGRPEYLLQLLSLEATLTRRVHDTNLKLGGVVRADRQNNVDKRENDFLVQNQVPGSDGGWVSGAGVDVVWDSRNNVFYPTRGGFSELQITYYAPVLGSDFEFTEVTADLRWYLQLGAEHVLGVQAYGALVGGDVPYFRLPKLGGGSRMRGYYEGRYRDRVYVMSQAEYRTQLFWRIGIVGFGGLGTVAPSLSALSTGSLKPSYGLGLRYLFDRRERVNIRADLGFGQRTSGIYFEIEEAF